MLSSITLHSISQSSPIVLSKIIEFAQEENIENIVTTEKDAVKIIDIIKDVDMPVKFYALRLNALVDIKEIIGE